MTDPYNRPDAIPVPIPFLVSIYQVLIILEGHLEDGKPLANEDGTPIDLEGLGLLVSGLNIALHDYKVHPEVNYES